MRVGRVGDSDGLATQVVRGTSEVGGVAVGDGHVGAVGTRRDGGHIGKGRPDTAGLTLAKGIDVGHPKVARGVVARAEVDHVRSSRVGNGQVVGRGDVAVISGDPVGKPEVGVTHHVARRVRVNVDRNCSGGGVGNRVRGVHHNGSLIGSNIGSVKRKNPRNVGRVLWRDRGGSQECRAHIGSIGCGEDQVITSGKRAVSYCDNEVSSAARDDGIGTRKACANTKLGNRLQINSIAGIDDLIAAGEVVVRGKRIGEAARAIGKEYVGTGS